MYNLRRNSQEGMNSMNCRYCGFELREGARFCSRCGNPVEKKQGLCEKCGTANDPNALYCQECGTRLKQIDYADIGRQNSSEQKEEARAAGTGWNTASSDMANANTPCTNATGEDAPRENMAGGNTANADMADGNAQAQDATNVNAENAHKEEANTANASAANPANSYVASATGAGTATSGTRSWDNNRALKKITMSTFYKGLPRMTLSREACNVTLYANRLEVTTILGGVGKGLFAAGKKRVFEKEQVSSCAYIEALGGILGAVKFALNNGEVYSFTASFPGEKGKFDCREMVNLIRMNFRLK